jgi:hypothetical protein
MPSLALAVVSLRLAQSIFFKLWKNTAFLEVHGSESFAFYAVSLGEAKVTTPFLMAAVNLNSNI